MNHGCDSGSSSSYGCELLRKLIYDARHELRELYERWEHRLTPYNFLSVAEQYVKGRLTVALDVDFSGRPNESHLPGTARDTEGAINQPIAVLVYSIHAVEGDHRQDGNEQPVFVGDVEMVQRVQRIALPSLVGLYDVDNEPCELGQRSLYRSAIDGRYQFLPRLADCEPRMAILSEVCATADFPLHIIERRTEVVNAVADVQGNHRGDRLPQSELEAIVAGIRVFFYAQTAKVSLNESANERIHVRDVLIGPYDL